MIKAYANTAENTTAYKLGTVREYIVNASRMIVIKRPKKTLILESTRSPVGATSSTVIEPPNNHMQRAVLNSFARPRLACILFPELQIKRIVGKIEVRN